MNTFNVYQILITDDMINLVNQVGRAEAVKTYPAVGIKFDSMFGRKPLTANDFAHYTKVAEVSAEGLNQVFEFTNTWERPEAVKKLRRMHSTSVGDVIHDTETDKFWRVAMMGFDDVTNDIKQSAG